MHDDFPLKVTSRELFIDFSVIFIYEHVHFLTLNVCQMEIPLKSCARSLMNLSLPSTAFDIELCV